MSIERARAHLKKYQLDERIQEFDVSSATVELAAAALKCEIARIAKTLSFSLADKTVLIVTAGDAKVDNQKFKAFFQTKAKMLPFDQVEEKTGHAVGGVCPFGTLPGVDVYLDESLKRFETVFPACGSANSAIELTVSELYNCSESKGFIDVCKGWA